MTLVLQLDEWSAASLARALDDYRLRCRVNGGRMSPVLEQLELLIAARSGPERPTVDGFELAPNDGLMSLLQTYEEAGRALSVSPRTVRRLVADGELKAVRIGSARRVHRDDLLNFAERLRGDHDDHKEED